MMIATLALLAALAPAAAPPTPAPPPKHALPESSIYQLPGRFETHGGTAVGLDVARGEPVLIAMFYATCPQACPMLIGDIKRVLAAVAEPERQRVRVILVSLDPEHDTPERLRDVVRQRELSPQWTLLRTDPSTTRALGAVLGVRYRAGEDGSIDHTSKILLLNGEGVVTATRDTIGADVATFAAAVATTVRHVAEQPAPPPSAQRSPARRPR